MAETPTARALTDALQSGRVCLTPTDTLPGLSFDPRIAAAAQRVREIKGRLSGTGYVSLVENFASALRWWLDPGPVWKQALTSLWPAPLTVVFAASPECPPSLLALDGSVALRVPAMSNEHAWMYNLLRMIDVPLPTTSVNRHGDAPCVDWEGAARFAVGAGVFVPPHTGEIPLGVASTIIRITAPSAFIEIRAGAVASDTIRSHLK